MHTATPWSIKNVTRQWAGQQQEVRRIIIGSPTKNGMIPSCEIQGPDLNMDDNAALIVQAVNAHERLTAFVKQVVLYAGKGTLGSQWDTDALARLGKDARALLAELEGKE